MAQTIQGERRSLQGIRQRVQSYLEETPGEESLWGTDELDEFIYQATLEIWDIVVLSYEMQFVKCATIDIVQGQAIYPLPRDFFKLRLMERAFSDGTIPVQRYERYETSNKTQVPGGTTGFVPTYRFLGSNVRLEPTPDTTETAAILLEYVSQPQPFKNDKEKLDTCFDQQAISLIILSAVMRAKAKEEHETPGATGVSAISRQFERERQIFKEVLEQRNYGRDLVEPFGIQDNDGQGGQYYF